MQHCSGALSAGALLVQALGDAQPVHGVYPVEVSGHGRGLVRLQAAHEMPGDRQIREQRDFGQGLLHITLAHVLQPCRCGLADAPGRMRLGDTHQRDGACSAPVQLRETRGLVEQETGTERNAVHRMPVVVAAPPCAGEDARLYRLTP